jgi:hypothetical protein
VKEGIEQNQSLGQLRLDPGNYQLRVTPAKIAGEELMNLRSIVLRPVSDTLQTSRY